MLAADYLIDIGPGAGENGGKLYHRYARGSDNDPRSLTGQYLSGKIHPAATGAEKRQRKVH